MPLEEAQRKAPFCIFNSQLRQLRLYLNAEGACRPSPCVSVFGWDYFSLNLHIKDSQNMIPEPDHPQHLVKNASSPPPPRSTESNSPIECSHRDFDKPSRRFWGVRTTLHTCAPTCSRLGGHVVVLVHGLGGLVLGLSDHGSHGRCVDIGEDAASHPLGKAQVQSQCH